MRVCWRSTAATGVGRYWRNGRAGVLVALAPLVVAIVAGCTLDPETDMIAQPRYDTFEASRQFADGMSARPLIPGAVTRSGHMVGAADEPAPAILATPAAPAIRAAPATPAAPPTPATPATPPMPSTPTLERLRAGRTHFDVVCANCHGRDGYGEGMIVRRGYPAAQSLHEPRLREATDEHIERVITHGLGKMPPLGGLLDPAARRAIVVYVRALQLSQNASVDDVPPEQLERLMAPAATQPAPAPAPNDAPATAALSPRDRADR